MRNKLFYTHINMNREHILMKLVCIFLSSTYTYAPLYNAFIKKLLQQKTEINIKLTL